MKLNTSIYTTNYTKTFGNATVKASDPISTVVSNFSNFTPDESLLICRQQPNTIFSNLLTINTYVDKDNYTYTETPCTFGVFPFIDESSSTKAYGCIDYSMSNDARMIPLSTQYPSTTARLLTDYDYKKLVAFMVFSLRDKSDRSASYTGIDSFLRNPDALTDKKWNMIETIDIHFEYNGQAITSNISNSVGSIMLSESENWFHPARGFLFTETTQTSKLNDKKVIINHDNLYVSQRSSTSIWECISVENMTKQEIINFLMEIMARLGYVFTSYVGGVYGDDTVYLPEILDGESTGRYFPTSNLEGVVSDNIEWENRKDIDVIIPTPEPSDEDDTEKMNIGGYYTAGGLVNYYSLVNTPDYRPLDLLSENLSSWDYVSTGKDVLRNLVSLKAFPLARDILCRGTSKEIIIAGTETGVNGHTVDSTYDTINLGSVSIPYRYNDFRDYAPYTKIELCCPFVGWLQLPSHCMGHDVNVKMTYDIITGSCTVYAILDENTIVAQACGCIAYDIPFTAESVGMKTAGMITGITGVASSALSLGTGLVSGNIVGSASGIIGLANSVTQTICANNANYTETKGTTGDSNSFAGVKQCYLKITYPISHIPENYGESVGYLYNNTTTLTQGMGFTKTSNTKITGTMLDTEQNEIKSLMESGVIL